MKASELPRQRTSPPSKRRVADLLKAHFGLRVKATSN